MADQVTETKFVPWVMPTWMERYRHLIGNTGGNSVESLVNDRVTTSRTNSIRAALIVSVTSQVSLLIRLYAQGDLGDPS